MKTRMISLLLVLCVIAVFAAGCGDNKKTDDQKTSDTAPATESAQVTTTTTQPVVTETEPFITDETYVMEAKGNVKDYTPLNYKIIKGVWVSQFDSQGIFKLDNEVNFRSKVTKLLKNVIKTGFNTVILQVRPNGDSFYPSEFFPESKFINGSYGWEKEFDPFAIFIDLAHEMNVSVHAWINPLRLMSNEEIYRVPEKFLIRQWYEDEEKTGNYVVEVTTGGTTGLYLNPAYEEVRQLIIDGAAEICRKYDVDGLQMDDYFYPTKAKYFDENAYNEANKQAGILTLGNWRRGNIDTLVKGIYSSVKDIDSRLIFGISPAGSIESNVNEYYADVKKWCREGGFIDYIAPQLYWSFNDKYAKFADMYKAWNDLMKNDDVRLIIGLALYKAGDEERGGGEWVTQKDIIKRELDLIIAEERCSGAMVFSYQDVVSDDRDKEAEVGNFVDTLKNWK